MIFNNYSIGKMKNKNCPKCGSIQIEENVYQDNLGILWRKTDSSAPQIIRECLCKNCGHFWKEFI
jgi:hypothetical protein